MNLYISIFNSIGVVCFFACVVQLLSFRINGRTGFTTRLMLGLSMLVYMVVCLTNVAEYTFASTVADSLEDISEIVFVLLFLFFVYCFRGEQNIRVIRENEELLRITFASIGEGILITDKDGRIIQVNKVMSDLTGWPVNECVGLPVNDVVALCEQHSGRGLDLDPCRIAMQAKKNVFLPANTAMRRRDGRTVQVANNTFPIFHDNGAIVGAVMVARDVEEQASLQQQLHHSRKMNAIGQMSGGIAHDFKNLIGGILGAVELIKVKIREEDLANIGDYAAAIEKAARKAADLASRLLTFSRNDRIAFVNIDLSQVINESLAIFERSIGPEIKIIKNLAPEPLTIQADPSQLESAILNLCVNGRDAMPEGGALTITTKSVHLDEEFCRQHGLELSIGSYAVVSVKDTGRGIPHEIRTKIFEPFFTTKEPGKGTGLGLSAVCSAIKSYRGAITLESEVNSGSIFSIYLPVVEVSGQ